MKTVDAIVLGILFAVGLIGRLAFAQQDTANCKDHPLFTRMPEYYISSCERKEFDAHKFYDPVTKQQVTIEGRLFYASYYLKNEFKGKKSTIQVARNHTNAITKIGGLFYMKDPTGRDDTYMKAVKDGKEIWASIEQDNWGGNTYYLYIVEKAEMEQQVVADARFMAETIASTGHVAIYGVYYDTDKAEIKSQSEPALAEMAKLLKGNASLNVFIVGHTDNTGTFEHNMKLSMDRAASVVNALVGKHGIAAARLKPYGVASLAPVASNKAEDGRAKNRRVELVER